MSNEQILLVLSDTNTASLFEQAALLPAGYEVTTASECQVAESLIKSSTPDLVILGDRLKDGDGLDLAVRILEKYPEMPIILLPVERSDSALVRALRIGVVDCLIPPVRTNDVIAAVQHGLQRRGRLQEWSRVEARKVTRTFQRRLESLEMLQQVGQSVTGLLDLDSVLSAVVDAAVELTGAEEGSLLLLDETTGELYMRAARNFQDEFVRTFRLPVRDTLAGQVLRTGKPITLDEKSPRKIKTAYLVHTLVYVPLQVHGRVIGVLGVDNRQRGHPFLDDHLTLMTALADYAAIAIENARSYTRTDIERSKLETIITGIEDGVIVVDDDNRLILANRKIREIFNLGEMYLTGKPVREIFHHTDLLEVLEEKRDRPTRSEINLEDGRVFNTQVTPIPDIGLVVIMQDITHLKELDRIKSDFVSTVSHDLRSPLTAILGYVELIDRAGPVTEQQREFIRRVQFSVNNITALINDLLDLGRIEAGFDARKEIVQLPSIVHNAIEGMRSRITEKEQELILDVPDDLPTILGNPVRLRQMLSNLIGNAIKYTSLGGKVNLRAQAEEGQIILQVVDNGPGIPHADQPYIFDKFYRGSNVPYDTPGTGLGLAIVKSIVENHQGRIWVESYASRGTTFTVVLPISDQEL